MPRVWPGVLGPPSTSRRASGSSSPGGPGSGSAGTSSASGPRRSSPTPTTARQGVGRRSGSCAPRAASGMRAWPTTPSSSTPSTLLPSMPPLTRPPIARRPPMRRLHLFVPHLPLALARARRSEPFPTGPLVLGGRPWDPGPVIDASPDVRALGVRRGLPLGSAHRLAPEATFVEPDPDADRAAAETVFEALARSSPSLAGTSDPFDAAFGLFEVGIDGLEALWGRDAALIGRVETAIRAALPADLPDLRPRVGIAGTRFAATIAAVHARPGAPVVVPPGGEAAFLADRPSGLLTSDVDVR